MVYIHDIYTNTQNMKFNTEKYISGYYYPYKIYLYNLEGRKTVYSSIFHVIGFTYFSGEKLIEMLLKQDGYYNLSCNPYRNNFYLNDIWDFVNFTLAIKDTRIRKCVKYILNDELIYNF